MIIDEKTNAISMTRGDSEGFSVSYDDENGAIVPFEDGDTVEFTVRKRDTAPEKLMHKVVTEFEADGTAYFTIEPKDTEGWRFGDYVYDVQWTKRNGWRTTIIKTSPFTVTSEVSYD